MLSLLLVLACGEPAGPATDPLPTPALDAPVRDGAPSPGDDSAPTPSSADADAPGPIVVYSGRGESMVGPLFARLEAETGLDVEVRYGDTPELVTLMLTEGAQSPADVIFAQDSGHLGALANRDMLATLGDDVTAAVDKRFKDPGNRWVGTSGRARVMVYDTRQVANEDLPATLAELADPKWKGKLGWAPSNGSFQAHVSALRHIWGEEQTRTWLTQVAANEPTVYPKNSPQVAAAAAGDIAIGWVNHYYLHRAKDGPDFPAANAAFSTQGDAGNVLMLAGMGVREGTARHVGAEKVVAWMLSETAQQAFAQDNFEYPTRTGVQTHADVPPVDSLKLAPLQQDWLADLGPTRVMLQELGLL